MKDIIMIISQKSIIITTKGKNIFQNKYKRERRYQKPCNSSDSKTEDEEIIVPRWKKKKTKKVHHNDDVDGDANKAYTYYNPTSPTDNDDDDDNVDDNEKTNVKTIKIIQKPTSKQKKGITKSTKV